MTKQEILSALRGGQHDLSLPASARQKVLDNAWIKPYLDSVKEAAESFRGKPIPSIPYSCFKLFHETGDRWMFEDSEVGYFPRRGRLAAFAVLSWLYGREEDLHELEDTIWAICDEYTWSVAAHLKPDAYTTQLQDEDYMVDLFASETAQALSEISFLLGDALPPIIKKRIDHLVKRRVLDRVLVEEFNWMHAASNWAAVCAGSVGMAAIYTLRDDEERLAEVLERVWPAFNSFLSSFAEDGSCLEGIGYWNYGFGYYTSFADLILRRTAGKIDLFAPEKVKKIALFQQNAISRAEEPSAFPTATAAPCSCPASAPISAVNLTASSSRRPRVWLILMKTIAIVGAMCCATCCGRWTLPIHRIFPAATRCLPPNGICAARQTVWVLPPRLAITASRITTTMWAILRFSKTGKRFCAISAPANIPASISPTNAIRLSPAAPRATVCR